MPSIVGPVKINSVASSGVVDFGDNWQITPKSTTKTYAGSGSFGTGDFHVNYNAISNTIVPDPDAVDSSNTANN
ncbi:MAG TPA: spore germination protein [Bacillales bacterium]|nr:spore germination protein [Bacillales bacterium]